MGAAAPERNPYQRHMIFRRDCFEDEEGLPFVCSETEILLPREGRLGGTEERVKQKLSLVH